MLSVVIAAATIAFAAAPPTAAAHTPAPLREIVFTYSYDRNVQQSIEEFGAPNLNVGTTNTFSGKVKADVMQVGGDGSIRVSATSSADNAVNQKKPFIADIVVRSDGSLVIVGGEYDAIMMTILPYLAAHYFGDHQLQDGASWKVVGPATDKTQTTTTYSVSNVSADTATVSSVGQAKGGDVSGTLSIETKVVYKASILVPLSLDVVVVRAGGGSTSGQMSAQDAQTHYHFDRISDTLETAGHGR